MSSDNNDDFDSEDFSEFNESSIEEINESNDIEISNETNETIITSKVQYKKDIDAIDIDFNINSIDANLRLSMLNIISILEYRNDTNIRINNIFSITSDQTRVQYIDKICKKSVLNITVDSKRHNGLDIICLKKNKNDNNNIIIPILLDRLEKYGEKIRIWNIQDTYINPLILLNHINGLEDNIKISIVTDKNLLNEISNKLKNKNLKKICINDPLIRCIGAVYNDIIRIEDDISIDYRLVIYNKKKK